MKNLIIIMIFLISVNIFSQEKKSIKKNSIFFIETSLGVFRYKNVGSLSIEFSAYYHYNNSLFSFKRKILGNAPLLDWNNPIEIYQTDEFDFMFGRRFINEKYSYSFLVGVSYSKNKEHNLNNINFDKVEFYGIPFEISIRLIKKDKRKMRFLGLFPFGKPTVFGFSTGIKFFGNLSKQSYVGLGVTFGFGNYKNYN